MRLELNYIIIDLSMIHTHSNRSLKSLATQINLTYSIIKHRLGPYRLILYSNFHSRYIDKLMKTLGRAKVNLYIGNLDHLLYSYSIHRPIYLDPYAYETLKYTDLLWIQSIILGGIVDKPKIKRATSRLREINAPYIQAKRIELRGSTIGVPEEINTLVKILFDAIELGSIEEAIRINQSKRYIIARAIYEMQKTRNICRSHEIQMKKLNELSSWLNIDHKVLKIVLNKICR